MTQPYREPSPPVVRPCECATGPLFDTYDDTDNIYPVCGPCVDRFTEAPSTPTDTRTR